jgi:hypothetical protein
LPSSTLPGAADLPSASSASKDEQPDVGVGHAVNSESSCGCPVQSNTGLLAGFSSREELEQWIHSKISSVLAGNKDVVQNDLDQLRSDIKSWTARHVTSELSSLRLAAENQQKDESDAFSNAYKLLASFALLSVSDD